MSERNKTQMAGNSPPADPGIVPVEQGNATDRVATSSTAAAANAFGPNNEQLPERLQNALRRIVLELTTESEISRRAEMRRIKQAHQFWRGMQYLWWSDRDQNWHLPFEEKFTDQSSLEDMPRYEFVTNIYQAFGLSIISVLSQDIPRVRFFPQSAETEADVSSAKAASEVSKLIELNNRVGNLVVEEAFHLWTGGKVGAYVRYVVDGQRFGFHPEMELDERQVKIGGVWLCPECGAESKNAPALHPGPQNASAMDCAMCGALLLQENFVPEEVITVPAGVRTLRVANGQEVITIVGALELKTPPWANEIHEYPFLQWNMEVHQARLRAAYPHAADKIGAPIAAGESAQYERLARLEQSQGGPLTAGGDYNPNLITFQRTWMRPWAFYQLDDKALRAELLALFPDGCYVAFAGDMYCESRNENVDDHWRVMHALPGDGQSGRPALGDSLISVQERYNTLSNMQTETYEYGIPPIYADPQVLDFDALQSQTAEPAAHYPAKAQARPAARSGFFSARARARSARSHHARRGFDGPRRAISDWRVSRAFWRRDDEHQHCLRLRHGARSGDGPHRTGVAAHEILLCRLDALGGRLLPQESPRRRRSHAPRPRRGIRIQMDSPHGSKRQSVFVSGNGRAVSDAVVRATHRPDAVDDQSRPAHSSRARRSLESRPA